MNRREHPRHAHDAEVVIATATQSHFARTRNISRGGLCAQLDDEIQVGTEVQVAIQLVFEPGARSEGLHVRARVAWCTKVDEEFQIGVAFRPLPEDAAGDLSMFLRFLEGERSARAEGERSARAKREASVDERFR